MNITPINKTAVFYSPIEEKDCLVTTGTVEGNILSFINSMLIACSRKFKNLSNEDRIQIIKKARDAIFVKINKKQWLIQGLNAFERILSIILKDFYLFINDKNYKPNSVIRKIGKELIKDKHNFELYKIITDILPQETFLNVQSNGTIDSYKQNTKVVVRKYLENLEELQALDDEHLDHILSNIARFTTVVLDEAEYVSFKTYTYDVDEVDDIFVDSVADYFDCNIYFINAKTRLPYTINKFEDFRKLNSIILLSFSNNHFEIVGKLLERNEIKREFLIDDSLIKRINKILNMKDEKEIESEEEKDTESEEDKDTENEEENEVDKDTENETEKETENEVEKETENTDVVLPQETQGDIL